MRNVSRIAALVAVFAAAASAQFEVNGPNADYRINGSVPSSVNALTHDVSVATPGVFDQTVITNANPQSGVILAFSTLDPTGAAIVNVPGLGIWNIGSPAVPLPGNVSIIGDGISFSQNAVLDQFYRSDNGNPLLGLPPTFRLAFNVGTVFCGTRVAFQAVVQDPSAGAFGLDITECGDANFVSGQDLILLTGDDGSVQVPFGLGSSFNFYGVNYTEVFVCGNGFISFGGFNTVNAAGFTGDNQSWLNAEPSVALCMTDWSIDSGGINDGVRFLEIGNQVTLTWGDPAAMPSGLTGVRHFADSDSNRFSATLDLFVDGSNPCNPLNPNEGNVTLNYAFFDAFTINRAGDGILGLTPGGGALAGGAFDRDLHSTIVGGANEAIFENHNATGNSQSTLPNMMGTLRAYNEVRTWGNNQSISFVPLGAPTGSSGYVVAGACSTVDDVGSAPLTLNTGATVTISGKFCGFGATGSVVLDPNGTAGFGPLPVAVLGVLDGTFGLPNALPNISDASAYRDGEGLVVMIPNVSPFAGTADLQVSFDSGYTETVSIVLSGGQTTTTYFLPDDGFVTHNLATPINFYGATYNSMFVNSNGYITFSAGAFDFTPSTAELFNGIGGFAFNPAVAPFYADLNRFGSGSTTDVIEDLITGDVTVSYINQQWWNGITPAGTVSVTFNAALGSLDFDHSALIASVNGLDTMVVGWSNTDSNPANDVAALAIGYTSVVISESIGQFYAGGVLPAVATFNGSGLWQALDVGSGSWSIF